MSVKYYLDKRQGKLTKEHPIRISAVVNGTRVQSTTGYSVKEKSWINTKTVSFLMARPYRSSRIRR